MSKHKKVKARIEIRPLKVGETSAHPIDGPSFKEVFVLPADAGRKPITSRQQSMDTKTETQSPAGQSPALAVDALLGRFFSRPDGSWWEVKREWKHRVMLERRSHIGTGGQITILKSEVVAPEWREHQMPKTLKIGDVMICNGERCEITSFQSLGSAGGFVGVTARWGFEEGHAHENLIPFGSARYLMAEGLRLPFDGELSA